MQKKSSSAAENMQHSNRVFIDTKIKELHNSFIQLEERDFFLFGKLIKPTAHIIRRGSLLESDKAQHWRGRIESDALPGRATFRNRVFETLLRDVVPEPVWSALSPSKRSNRRRTEQWYRECESERSTFSTPRRRRSTPGKELGSSFGAVCVAM